VDGWTARVDITPLPSEFERALGLLPRQEDVTSSDVM